MFGPRSEDLREGGAGWLCLSRGSLLADGALRFGCGRGRGLFFGWLLLVLSNELGLLVAERIGNLAAGVAEVELQDRLSDVLVRSGQKIAPPKIARGVPTRKQIDRAPMSVDVLDEPRVTKRLVDGGERARRLRIERFE